MRPRYWRSSVGSSKQTCCSSHGRWSQSLSAAEGKEPDPRLLWARTNSVKACRHGPDYSAVKRVLERVSDVIDPDKASGAEDADPYVIALALRLREAGEDATVVTEDRKDKPAKMSLATACGLWSIPTVPFEAFLAHLGIWTRPKE